MGVTFNRLRRMRTTLCTRQAEYGCWKLIRRLVLDINIKMILNEMKIMRKRHYVSLHSERIMVERSALLIQSITEDNNADAKQNVNWEFEENEDNQSHSRFDLWK